MIILGISFLSDASACLLIDGKIIAAISEERINRKKLWNGIPRRSIEKVLEISGINMSDVDYIATHGTHLNTPDYEAFKSSIDKINSSNLSDNLKNIQLSALDERYKKELKVISERTPKYIEEIKKLDKKVCVYEHHQAHAATAFFGSGWDQSYVLTADGWGEDGSNSFWEGSGLDIDKISYSPTIDSLGYFYGSITKSLGFTPHRHEGKILGLAAYDTKQESYKIIKEMISYDAENNRFSGDIHNGIYKPSYDNPQLDHAISKYSREDVASSTQRRLEEVVFEFLSGIDDNDIRISLSGGVFANVKVNQRIKDHPSVSDVYVFPNMGDGGLSIGAAWLAYAELTGNKPDALDTALLGNSVSDGKILTELKKTTLHYQKKTSINKEIAKLLSKGEVVARVSGPMEFGPRALGNRSILCEASDSSVNTWLNQYLNRSEFMPFAPMTIIDDVDKYYVNINGGMLPAKYMTMTFDCTQRMTDEAPATVHVDKTARPQFITKDDYPDMFEVLLEYKKITGLSNIVNTSFNMHEEPIVSTELDAVNSFLKSGIKWMALGNYLVKNNFKI
jgi:carbamoyltransferase